MRVLFEFDRVELAELDLSVVDRELPIDESVLSVAIRLPRSDPSSRWRVALDEKQIEVDGEKKWLYAAVDTDSKMPLEIEVFSRRRTDHASALLHRLTTNHDVSDTEFLVDAGGYLTALTRRKLRGQLDYSERNLVKNLSQTVTMRTDRFHSFCRGSLASAERWLRRFKHYYNHDRPNQALDGRTPVEEVLN